MHNHVVIVINDVNKTLTLTLPNNMSEGDIIGPYSAMYYHLHENYKWINYDKWCGTNELDVALLRKRTAKVFWEYFQNDTVIVDESFVMFNHLGDIIEDLGYFPGYILQIETGEIDLANIKHKDYAFGEGDYFYDIKNMELENTNDNKYTHYNGEYLRCISDAHNEIKSGQLNIKDQEIFIPFLK